MDNNYLVSDSALTSLLLVVAKCRLLSIRRADCWEMSSSFSKEEFSCFACWRISSSNCKPSWSYFSRFWQSMQVQFRKQTTLIWRHFLYKSHFITVDKFCSPIPKTFPIDDLGDSLALIWWEACLTQTST